MTAWFSQLRAWSLPGLALIGFAFGVVTVVRGNQEPPTAPPLVEPARAPYADFIAGAGMVEAASRNIEIATPLAGVVQSLLVGVGDAVQTGAPLLRLDDRAYLAEQQVRTAAVDKAKADVAQAEAEQAETAVLLRLAQAVEDKRAISAEELEKRKNALSIAKAKTEALQAAWRYAQAQRAAIQTDLERLTVRAPLDATVLQLNVRPGEYASLGATKPLFVLGDTRRLNVRVDIDENDAWKFQRHAHAVAFLRGHPQARADLSLAWVEPYVIPKRNLTGDSSERVDTRVLQVVYRFDPAQLPAYVGQQMDVYIERQGD